MQTIDIEKICNWSAPKRVKTARGERDLLTAAPTEAFKTAFGSSKRPGPAHQQLRDAGLGWGQDRTGNWVVNWWRPVDPVAAKAEQQAAPSPAAPEAADTALDAALAAVAGKLLPYQVPAVKMLAKALETHGGALDASDTGTGKTYVSLAACAALGKPVFVVCPKAVIPSWKRAAAHFGIALAGIGNYEMLRRGTDAAVKLVENKTAKKPTEEFRWNLPPGTAIVFDECHRMKDHKTLNNKLGMAALRQGYKVIGLSATAADNPTQMKFAARLTKQIADERQFFGWMLRNGVIRGRFGLEFTGGKRVLADLHHRIFPTHGSRLRIADLGDAFPETQIATVSFDMNGVAAKIQAAYDDMADEIAALEEREASDRGACILTARLRARQRSEILKAPAIAQLAEDQIEEGMSVAVFVNFDDVLDAVAAKLGTKCVVRGGQTAEEREANVAAFQADKSPVIVCNIKAGGVGISLHGSPSARMRYSIICPSDSSQDMKQALGRVWRANGAKSIQRIFLAAGTIEEKVYANAVEKIGRIDALNDGDGNPKPETQPEAEAQPQPQPTLVTSVTVPDAAPAPVASQAPVAPVSEALREFVHAGLRRLAGMDTDHAKVVNGVGFSKMDNEFGHSLAMRARLSDRMAWAAARLCNRYRGQLGGDDYKAQLDALTGGAK